LKDLSYESSFSVRDINKFRNVMELKYFFYWPRWFWWTRV